MSRRAFPGIYMSCDPRAGRARADVEAMVAASGRTHERMLAIEADGFAMCALSSPVNDRACGPGLHHDAGGLLVWTGEMRLPDAWHEGPSWPTPNTVARIVRDRLSAGGVEILSEIDGGFCGAWFDGGRQRWTVFNDRWGLIPLFWWNDHERLIVSPRAHLTWQASEAPLEIDTDGIVDLIRTQNMVDDHTLIDGVHWLESANALLYDGAHARPRPYWSYIPTPRETSTTEMIIDDYLDACGDTVKRTTDAVDAPMLGISGGLDSRLFLAVAHAMDRMPACYTLGLPYGEDTRFGRQVARAAHAPHEVVPLCGKRLCEQLRELIVDTDGLHGAAYMIVGSALPDFLEDNVGRVVLEGHMHGVLGGATLPAASDVPADRPAHTHRWARNLLHSGGDFELINNLLRADLAAATYEQWKAHADAAYKSVPDLEPLYRVEHAIVNGRNGRIESLFPATMRRDTLVRHPGCDRSFIEWARRTPAEARVSRGIFAHILRERFPRFARIPRGDGCSGLPLTNSRWQREIAWQREKLYSAWARWRYPEVRRYGRDNLGLRAWGFAMCRDNGFFEPLLAGDARMLRWIRPGALQALWQSASDEPRRCVPLFNLATAEFMIRRLEATRRLEGRPFNVFAFARVDLDAGRKNALVEAI